jgi:hypothetical protein
MALGGDPLIHSLYFLWSSIGLYRKGVLELEWGTGVRMGRERVAIIERYPYLNAESDQILAITALSIFYHLYQHQPAT